MPYYCETALNTLGTFPYEPVNALTSFVPAILGILAFLFLRRHGHRDPIAYALAILTIMTGLGSVAWHSFRTSFALTIDVMPGLIYFLLIALAWAYRVGNWAVAVAMAALVGGLIYVAPPMAGRENLIQFLVVIVALAVTLVIATRIRKPDAFHFGLLAVGCGLTAATFRTLDLYACDVIPIGTHFFWHIFLGIAAYAGVRLMVLLRQSEPLDRQP